MGDIEKNRLEMSQFQEVSGHLQFHQADAVPSEENSPIKSETR